MCAVSIQKRLTAVLHGVPALGYYMHHFARLNLNPYLLKLLCYNCLITTFQNGKREKANIMYNTSLPVLFGIKKYADSLWQV